ncbi:MAG TPA: NUDIX hydrolase [Bradyrhizobium sp.]|nr:NUDIX hydrolase [Bradyrhizobium sp.]
MARTPVQAAGGIVLRQAKPPLIAVVRLRKRNEWVLPKGKLDDGETHREAAEREVNEETGHDVTVHEFLGTLVYEASGRSKIVHYWRMQADGEQVYELMTDIREVDWVPLEVALTRLSRASERSFLEHVGPMAIASALADMAKRKAKAAALTKSAPPAKPAPTAKTASSSKAAPAKKRRTPPAAPVQPAPAAPEPTQTPIEVLLAAPPPAPVAPATPETVAREPADSTPMLDAPEPPPAKASEPGMIEQLLDQPELIQSAGAAEKPDVPEQADPAACEPVQAATTEVNSARPVPIEASGVPANALERRRKTLAEKLRNWLGSVA